MPVVKKKCSDLLSMWVGGTEKNIAAAFEEGKENQAVLILDEADSFLQDRSNAVRSWEVTQVNEMLTQMENYPYPIKTVEAETTEIVFPKNLFVGDDGKIVILMDVYDEICCNIVYYQIKDDKICLRKEPEKNGDVIIVYAED